MADHKLVFSWIVKFVDVYFRKFMLTQKYRLGDDFNSGHFISHLLPYIQPSAKGGDLLLLVKGSFKLFSLPGLEIHYSCLKSEI